MSLPAGAENASKEITRSKLQTFISLVKEYTTGAATGGGSAVATQMLDNAIRGNPVFENAVKGLMIGVTAATVSFVLVNGSRLFISESPNSTQLNMEAREMEVLKAMNEPLRFQSWLCR